MQQNGFTPRQREVLDLLAKRRTNQQIADELGISLDGAKWHMREVLQVYGVDSREQAAERWRVENGLPRRLWRMTWSLGQLPLLVGGAAAVLVVAVVAFAVLRGGGRDEPPTAPEATATGTGTVTLATPTPATAATAAPTRPATATPGVLRAPSRATGDPFLDYVTSHVESNNNVALTDLAGQLLPCSIEESITYPACPGGAVPGTLVLSIIPFACDIKWTALTAQLNIVEGGQTLRLHSILVPGTSYTRPPAAPSTPDFWMLFTNSTPSPAAGYAIAVKDDKIVSFGRSCGPFETLETRLLQGSTGYLLPP